MFFCEYGTLKLLFMCTKFVGGKLDVGFPDVIQPTHYKNSVTE